MYVWHIHIYIYTHTNIYIGLQCRRPGFDPWVGKIPWRKEWQPTAIFLPGEFHEQRSLAGYSPGACKEWEPTEQLTLSLSSPPCGASHPHSHPTLVDWQGVGAADGGGEELLWCLGFCDFFHLSQLKSLLGHFGHFFVQKAEIIL